MKKIYLKNIIILLSLYFLHIPGFCTPVLVHKFETNFFSSPIGVTVDFLGNMYVSDSIITLDGIGNIANIISNIYKYDSTGNNRTPFLTSNQSRFLGIATGKHTDGKDTLYLTESQNLNSTSYIIRGYRIEDKFLVLNPPLQTYQMPLSITIKTENDFVDSIYLATQNNEIGVYKLGSGVQPSIPLGNGVNATGLSYNSLFNYLYAALRDQSKVKVIGTLNQEISDPTLIRPSAIVTVNTNDFGAMWVVDRNFGKIQFYEFNQNYELKGESSQNVFNLPNASTLNEKTGQIIVIDEVGNAYIYHSGLAWIKSGFAILQDLPLVDDLPLDSALSFPNVPNFVNRRLRVSKTDATINGNPIGGNGILSVTGSLNPLSTATLLLQDSANDGLTRLEVDNLQLNTQGILSLDGGKFLMKDSLSFNGGTIEAHADATIQLTNPVGNINVTGNHGTIDVDQNVSLQILTPIVKTGTNLGKLIKQGLGELRLTKFYNGSMDVGSGVVSVSEGDDIGEVDLNNDKITLGTNASSATLRFLPAQNNIGIFHEIVLKAGGGIFDVLAGSGASPSVISGVGSLIKIGPNPIFVSSPMTYIGGTNLNQGKIYTGADNVLPVGGDVFIATAGILDLSIYSQTIKNLTGLGLVTSDSGDPDSTATLTLMPDVNSIFSGNIEDGTGQVAITLNSPGIEQKFTGINTFSGGLTLTAGTIAIAPTTLNPVLGTGLITMEDGTMLRWDLNVTLPNQFVLNAGNPNNQGITMDTGAHTGIIEQALEILGKLIKKGAGELKILVGGTNSGTLDVLEGTFTNEGVGLTNNAGATISNDATFNNTGDIYNFGDFLNNVGAILTSAQGSFSNSGTLTNDGTIISGLFGNEVGANLYNNGTITYLANNIINNDGNFNNNATVNNIGDFFNATNANFYNNGLFVNTGTLSGDGNFIFDGGEFQDFNSQTLDWKISFGGNGNGGTFTSGPDNILTLTQLITGDESLTLKGPGMIQLQGDSLNYTGVSNISTQAKVGIYNEHSLGTGDILMTDDSKLQFKSPNLTLTNSIDLGNNGQSIFQTDYATTIDGIITDNGNNGFVKTGSAPLTLTRANASRARVTEGTLIVEGSIGDVVVEADGRLTGLWDAINNRGFVGHVSNEGIVVPRDPVGEFRIKGDYSSPGSGTIQVDVTPLAWSKLHVEGTAHLNGTRLAVNVVSGETADYKGKTFEILSSDNLIDGQFDTIQSSQARYRFKADYTTDPYKVFIEVGSRTLKEIVSEATSDPNKTENAGSFDTVYEQLNHRNLKFDHYMDILLSLSPKEAADAVAMIVPEETKDLAFSVADTTSQIFDVIGLRTQYTRSYEDLAVQRTNFGNSISKTHHFRQIFNKFKQSFTSKTTLEQVFGEQKSSLNSSDSMLQNTLIGNNQGGIWIQGYGDHSKQKEAYQQLSYHARTGGGLVGIDYKFKPNLVIGAMMGHGVSRLHFQDDAMKARIKDYFMGMYSTFYLNNFYIDTSLIIGLNRFSTDRKIKFADIDLKAKGRHNGMRLSPHIGFGYTFKFANKVKLTPFMKVDYIHVLEKGYKEHNADILNLNMKKKQTTFLKTKTGINLSKDYVTDFGIWTPKLTVGINNSKVLRKDKVRANLMDLPLTLVADTPTKTQTMLAPGLSLNYSSFSGLFSSVGYSSQLNRRFKSHEVTARLGWKF